MNQTTAAPGACPVPLEALPPAVQRSVSPASPVPMRMMAARGLLPCGPRDLVTALFFLSFDADANVAKAAVESASKLQDKILGAALRDEDVAPPVLAFYAKVLKDDNSLELIALNPATSDEAFADIALTAGERVCETVAQNQLRVLRDERIVRSLVRNPNARKSTVDGLLDFCVRSGLSLLGVPEFEEARRRVLGSDAGVAEQLAEAEINSADRIEEEFGEAVTQEGAEIQESKRLTLTQRIMKMSVAEKIKLASRGNKEARQLLLRDSNKLVSLSALENPRITEGEIVMLANSRTLPDDVMRAICKNREWTKNYQVKNNLVNNPKTPVSQALKWLPMLYPTDLKAVARNKNIPAVLQNTARVMLQAKGEKKKEE